MLDRPTTTQSLPLDQTKWGGTDEVATADIFLNNLSDKPIAYKLKTNRRNAFKVTPCAVGVVGGKRMIRLRIKWISPPSSDDVTPMKMETTSSAMLLLQTRFIPDHFDINNSDEEAAANQRITIARQMFRNVVNGDDAVTQTEIAAEIRSNNDNGSGIVGRTQVFLDDSRKDWHSGTLKDVAAEGVMACGKGSVVSSRTLLAVVCIVVLYWVVLIYARVNTLESTEP